ncbi:MAG: flagellar GTP-binding protein [Undibacterium sp.]|nr:flagellar GTP-binding protein [Opitutaceae bacterium]
MSAAPQPPAPGAYKFTVRSAEHAVALIREKLGPSARVLSVRPIESKGLFRFLRPPSLEVIAQIDAPASVLTAVSSGPATPPSHSHDFSADSRRQPPPTTTLGLAGLLRRSGLSEPALNRLQTDAQWSGLAALPLHRALAETSRLLRAQADARPSRAPLSRAAFLGTAGVGRTTALCKWISSEVFRRARGGHVVAVEFDKPNSLGPLTVFSQALGVPLAHFPCETQIAVPGGFVYFDLPAFSSLRPADNRPLAAWLDREQINERVLVLNAAYDRASLRDAHAAGRDLGATHLVFTHLDEVPQWGKLWDYLFDEALEPLFLSTGPSLTGDLEDDVPGALARRTLADS